MTKYSQTYPKLTGLHNYCILKKGIERGEGGSYTKTFCGLRFSGDLFISCHLR